MPCQGPTPFASEERDMELQYNEEKYGDRSSTEDIVTRAACSAIRMLTPA